MQYCEQFNRKKLMTESKEAKTRRKKEQETKKERIERGGEIYVQEGRL